MPDKKTLQRAARDKRQGKAASTQAGEFVREEIEHVREGKHGVKSTKQAIAIGLSKARRAGVDLPPPKKGKRKTVESAKRAYEEGRSGPHKPSRKRSQAATKALKGESRAPVSKQALARQAHSAAQRRTKSDRSAAARRGAATRAEHAGARSRSGSRQGTHART